MEVMRIRISFPNSDAKEFRIGDMDDVFTVQKAIMQEYLEDSKKDNKRRLKESVEEELINEYFGDTEYGSFQEVQDALEEYDNMKSAMSDIYSMAQEYA